MEGNHDYSFVMGSQEAPEICTQAKAKAFIVRGLPASTRERVGRCPRQDPEPVKRDLVWCSGFYATCDLHADDSEKLITLGKTHFPLTLFAGGTWEAEVDRVFLVERDGQL